MALEIYNEERPWGGFKRFTHNIPSTVKILHIKEGEAFSLQSHTKREEFWKVIKGSGIIEIGGEIHQAKEGDEYNINLGVKHRISGGRGDIYILEIATGDFDEDDIVRFEDKYGRV